jgi:RNA methyltransferase, TrmH family
MARTADAAGADALVVAEAQADPWNPNAIRASTGAVFSLPVVEATLDEIRALPTRLLAAMPDAPTAYTEVDLTARTTLAIGAEDVGLPDAWIEASDFSVSIPLHAGTTDSLNAATAAAIILFEARRQRDHA